MPSPIPILPVGSRPAVPTARTKQASAPEAQTPETPGRAARPSPLPATDHSQADELTAWVTIVILTGLVIYSYWPGLLNARASWDNPQYQHGWIVPAVNLVMLALGRASLGPVSLGPVTWSARLAGAGLLAGSLVLRLVAANFRIVTIDMYTFVPALAGVFLLAGGWKMFQFAWKPIFLSIFMFPLPDEAQRYITGPLQLLNTTTSTILLQTLGFDAVQEGNLVRLGGGHVMNVVDACAGLKMLTTFVWLCACFMAFGGLNWWENIVIGASSIPIAILANTLRITTAGVLYNVAPAYADHFHDSTWASLLMAAVAFSSIFLLITVLSHLVIHEDFAPATVLHKAVPEVKNRAIPPRPGPAGKARGGDSRTGHVP